MKAKNLNKEEYLPYFQPYIDKIGDLLLVDGLEKGLKATLLFFRSIPLEKLEFRYQEDKWTIKEILSHLIDAERVFTYRALRFARQDKTPVMGFNEDDYVLTSNANSRTIENLLTEYNLVRQSSIALYNSFNTNDLMQKGVAGSGTVSVRALGFLIAGHENHHCQVIKERYL